MKFPRLLYTLTFLPLISDAQVCNQGDLRLRDGGNRFEGRVEMCYNNSWGTVCDDFWSIEDANVACKQLGFNSTGATILTGAHVIDGTGKILLDNVRCTGTESRLIDCLHNAIGVEDCSHSEDAGVRCLPIGGCDGEIRLVGGSSYLEGRVEVCYNNTWGTVCDDSWNSTDASVACRQLGYPARGATARTNAHFSRGTGPILFDDVNCKGNEIRLADCVHNGVGRHNCAHSEDAGVTCPAPSSATICTEGEVRLVNGIIANSQRGLVQFCHNNEWGTVCNDGFGNNANAASVVCNQLGFNRFGVVATGFGQGSGPIWLDNVACIGNEERLADCPANIIGSNDCSHSQDVGVMCLIQTPCRQGDVRLAGGLNNLEGRVEFCNNNQWGTVCQDRFGAPETIVVCKQLGFSDSGATVLAQFQTSPGSGPIWLDQLACTGEESGLASCRANQIGVHDCTHAEDVGIQCLPKSSGHELSSAQLFGVIFSVSAAAAIIITVSALIYYKKNNGFRRPTCIRRSASNTSGSTHPRESSSRINLRNSRPYRASAASHIPRSNSTPSGISSAPQNQYSRIPLQQTEITLTTDEPPPSHVEATTHDGEAPPAYHTIAQYQTTTLNALTKETTPNKPPSITLDTDPSVAPPAYSVTEDSLVSDYHSYTQ